jgi:hypothetical protein
VVNQIESACPAAANISANPGRCLNRATGWVKLVEDTSGAFTSRSYEKPSDIQTCDSRTCLFDLHSDPTERTDVSAQNPDVVAKLMARIQEYNRTLVPNVVQPFDMNSCPVNFATDAWTPWLNSTPPLPPAPPYTPPGLNSSTKLTTAKGQLSASGWVCDGKLLDHGYSPTTVIIRISPPLVANNGSQILATIVANVKREGLNTTHDVCPNQLHGFTWTFDPTKMDPATKYKLDFNAVRAPAAGGKEQEMEGGAPYCVKNGKVLAKC